MYPALRSAACPFQRPGEVVGERRRQVDLLPAERMGEPKPVGVEELALEPEIATDPVHGVTAHRQLDRRQMDADLVCTTGLETDFEQRALGHQLDHLEPGDRITR